MPGLTPTMSFVAGAMAAGHAASMAGAAVPTAAVGDSEPAGLATTGYQEAFVQVPLWRPRPSSDKAQHGMALPVGVALLGAALFVAGRRLFSQFTLMRQFDRPPVYRPGFDWAEPGPTVGERIQSVWRSGQSRLQSVLTLWRSPPERNAPLNPRPAPPAALDPATLANIPAGRLFRAEGLAVRPIAPGPEGPVVDRRSPRPSDVRLGWLTYPSDAETPVIVPLAIARQAVRDRRALFFSAPGEGVWWVEPVLVRNDMETSWPAPHAIVVGLKVGRHSLEDNPDREASVTLPWVEAWATEDPMTYHPMTGVNREFSPSDWSGYTPLTWRMRQHVSDTLWARLEAQWSSWSVAEKDAVNVLSLATISGQWGADLVLQVLRILLEGDGAARLLVRRVADMVHEQQRSGVIAWTPIVPVLPDPNGTRAAEQGVIQLIMPPNSTPPSPFGEDIDPELRSDVAVTLTSWTLRSLAQHVEEVVQALPGAQGWNSLYPPAIHPNLATPAYVRNPDHQRRVLK